MNDKQLRQIAEKKERLSFIYGQIKDAEAVADLLEWLDSREKQNRSTAEAEMNNPVTRSLYLQNAIVYGKVALYLRDKFSDTPHN